MTKQFNPDAALLAAVDHVAGRLQQHETRVLRAAQATKYRILAEAYDLVFASTHPVKGNPAKAPLAAATQLPATASLSATAHLPAAAPLSPTAANASRLPVTAPPVTQLAVSPCSTMRFTDLAFRSIRCELATMLNLSERTIERHLSDAYTFAHQFPAALDALETGVISDTHTRIITTAGEVIGVGDDEVTAARRHTYTQAVLAFAVDLTPAQLRPIAERLAEQFTEHTIDERHEQAKQGRAVYVRDLCDGMSELLAVLPAAEAHAIHDRLTRMAKQQELLEAAALADDRQATAELAAESAAESAAELPAEMAAGATSTTTTQTPPSAQSPSPEQATPATPSPASPSPASPLPVTPFAQISTPTQTLPTASLPRIPRDHRRADLFSDLLLRANPEQVAGTNPVKAVVHITVTDEVLFAESLRLANTSPDASTNASENSSTSAAATALAPAELAGCGSIPSSAARTLASSVNTWRLVHHDPYTGDVIRVEQYSPTLEQRQFLAARDQHCRFPGCRAVAHRCDIDHTHDHALGGNTSTDNLAHLCRGHHMLKHHGGWSVKQKPAGVLEWRSPTGRVYKDRPPSRVRFEATARPAPPAEPAAQEIAAQEIAAPEPGAPEPPCAF